MIWSYRRAWPSQARNATPACPAMIFDMGDLTLDCHHERYSDAERTCPHLIYRSLLKDAGIAYAIRDAYMADLLGASNVVSAAAGC